MLRIAMLSYHTCPLATLGGKDTGGMNVYVRDLTCELGRMGIHVDVFTRSQDEHVPHVVHELGFGNRVVHVPAGPEAPKSKSEMANYIPEFVEGIKQFAAEKGITYDVIHSHYWMSGLAAEALSDAWGGTPIVHMFHTLGEMKNRVARSEDERAGEDRLKGERQVLGRADRIVVATLAELTQLRFLYRANDRKLVVIPPGVDTSHFYPIPADEAKQYIGLKPDNRMVLFVGRIEPLKGVDTLIQAMSCLGLNEAHQPVHLAIIGGEPDVTPENMSAEMTRLQKMCDDLCMGGMVVFLGKRGQDTLPYYYSAAEVLVMPSLYESFGMVALEAMACGTPVIASEVGGLGYLVQDGATGYTIPDSDPEALCNKLSGLLGDAHLRETMGLHAAEYALDYAWANIAAQIVDVYKGLVEKRSVGLLFTDGSRVARS
ncbi:MAG: glycosyltransferase [Anaerolineales bacterium]|jgi:D-inositol-3-phosphate glycosyltransferase|uniref:glycosyltransferase n=1 Tax=Candidatus Villigracilis affinis TaxID=3140682 RepID=UPI001B5D0FB3|nr:glycosyltransferase [Anaerolineales bacterium]MBK9604770.1 glycosyltransferase [Anaerolineales bacterium]MBL0345742.1 glycosyltransferase [Anaerolineales bacterium]MBP8048223.1 glycosyltransferase [Anaerolineales bacterium]